MCRKNLDNPIVVPCDYWGLDSLLTVGENKLQKMVEIDINGQFVYLDYEQAKKVANHLNLLVKFEEDDRKAAFEAGAQAEKDRIQEEKDKLMVQEYFAS